MENKIYNLAKQELQKYIELKTKELEELKTKELEEMVKKPYFDFLLDMVYKSHYHPHAETYRALKEPLEKELKEILGAENLKCDGTNTYIYNEATKIYIDNKAKMFSVNRNFYYNTELNIKNISELKKKIAKLKAINRLFTSLREKFTFKKLMTLTVLSNVDRKFKFSILKNRINDLISKKDNLISEKELKSKREELEYFLNNKKKMLENQEKFNIEIKENITIKILRNLLQEKKQYNF